MARLNGRAALALVLVLALVSILAMPVLAFADETNASDNAVDATQSTPAGEVGASGASQGVAGEDPEEEETIQQDPAGDGGEGSSGVTTLSTSSSSSSSSTNHGDPAHEGDCDQNGEATHNYAANCDGTYQNPGPGGSDNGHKPADGTVGNADNIDPRGQANDGNDHNRGYECEPGEQNKGIGDGNPSHTGCTTDDDPPDTCPSGTDKAGQDIPTGSDSSWCDDEEDHKVLICHATGSENNPWEVIEVDASAWSGGTSTHSGHEDDFLTESDDDADCESSPPTPNTCSEGTDHEGETIPEDEDESWCDDEEDHKVLICHATGSENNPWEVIEVDASAWSGGTSTHSGHEDDFLTESEDDADCESSPPPPCENGYSWSVTVVNGSGGGTGTNSTGGSGTATADEGYALNGQTSVSWSVTEAELENCAEHKTITFTQIPDDCETYTWSVTVINGSGGASGTNSSGGAGTAVANANHAFNGETQVAWTVTEGELSDCVQHETIDFVDTRVPDCNGDFDSTNNGPNGNCTNQNVPDCNGDFDSTNNGPNGNCTSTQTPDCNGDFDSTNNGPNGNCTSTQTPDCNGDFDSTNNGPNGDCTPGQQPDCNGDFDSTNNGPNGDCTEAPPPTDVCPNIEDNQSEVPDGMGVDEDGNCAFPDTVLGVRFNKPNLHLGPDKKIAPAVLPARVEGKAEPAAGVLPFTGGNLVPFLMLAGMLILTGGGLVARRKDS